MADNTASSNAANTQAPTATGASTEKTTQVFTDAPAAHQNGLSGSEGVAKQIVDSSRAENAPLSQYQGLSAADNADLNEITPAAGQPMGKSGAPMADMNMQSNVASGMAAHTLTKPAAGHTEVVHVSSGEMIATQFNPDDADLRMSGDDLVLSFNDGSKIVLDGFAQDAQNLPTIALPNGALVAGGIIVAQLQGTQDEIFNLETAAGGAGRSNGGFFIYSDNMGDVIDLLSKLPPIPFTALQFAQPQPEVTVSDFDPAEGDFFPGFETVDGMIKIAGGYEDWQGNQDDVPGFDNPELHIGQTGVTPMALNITFVPHDNEIVEDVTISNIPADVRFFYRDAGGNVTELTLTNGSVTLTGDQLASGQIWVLPPTNSGKDIPMTISMTISDPNTENTAVITKNVVAVVDSVADIPTQLDTSTISIGTVSGGSTTPGSSATGNEIDVKDVNLALKVNFNDNDGSETHTIIIQGVPPLWIMEDNSNIDFDDGTLQSDGTMTYVATVTGNVNTTITFDPNEWTSQDNGDAHIKVIAKTDETITDNELDPNNNTAQTEVTFDVHIEEDIPVVVTPNPNAPPAVILEHSLDIPGVDQVGGNITVDFKSDGNGAKITFSQDNKAALEAMGLKSGGKEITYTVENGKIVATTTDGQKVFEVTLGTQTPSDGNKQTVPYTFTLFKPLDHVGGNGVNIDIPFKFTAEDSDHDKVDGSFQIRVEDDNPTVGSPTHTIDETNGLNAVLTGSVNPDFHADGPNAAGGVTATNAFTASGSTGGTLKSGGVPIIVTLVGNTYVGKAGDKEIFTLQINANGTYTFTQKGPLDHGNPNDANDSISLKFGYQAKDFDGDTAAGTITINVLDDAPTVQSVERTIDETDGLNAVLTGSVNPDFNNDGAGGVSGTQFSASGSVTSGGLTSNGHLITITLVNNTYVGKADGKEVFTLQINSDGTYTFTQKGQLDHADGTNPNDVIDLKFGYVAKDADGDSANGSITIHVKDDAPIAYDDHNSVPDGTTVATGNVITGENGGPGAADDLSNDHVNVLKDVSANGVTKSFDTPDGSDAGGKYVLLQGDYGTLKIYENGEYTYTYDSAAHGPGHDRFDLPDYALEFPVLSESSNVEGHLTPAQIQTLVNTANAMQIDFPTTVSVELVKSPGTVASYMNGLGAFTLGANGSISNVDLLFGNATANASNPLSGNDLKADYNMTSNSGRVVFFIIQNGLAQLQALGLADAQGRATDPAGSLSLEKQADGSLKLIYTDSQGHQTAINAEIYTSEKSLNGDDQDHTIGGKAPGTDDGLMLGFEDKTGTTNDGSDRDFNDVMFHVTVADRYTPGGEMDDVFTYTLIDKDGDTSQANLDFHITDNGPGTPPAVSKVIDETTDINASISDTIVVPGASNYALGSPSGAAPFSATGSLAGGSLKSDGVGVTVSFVNGQYIGKAGDKVVFTLSMNPNGTYTFVQKAPIDHADGNDANDVINLKFAYTAKDADGDAVANTITISIKDDAPIAAADTNNVPDGATTATGNVITNDTLSKDVVNLLKDASFGGTTKSFGSPDGSDANGKFVVIAGQYGTLKIYQNGQYTYTVNANNVGNHTEQFKYTLVDKDGDTSKTTLTLNIVDNGPGTPPAITKTIDETTDIGTSISGTITVPGATIYAVGSPNGNATFSSGGSQLGGSLKSNGVPVTVSIINGQYVGKAGTVEVFTLKVNADGSYTFVQKAPLDHADGTDANDIINLNFTYTAKDADGDAVSNTITINVKDDAPLAVADTNSVPDGVASVNGNVITNDVMSKDVPNILKDVAGKSFDGASSENGVKYITVQGQYGTLKIFENGSYTYTVNANNTGNHVESFQYTLVDKDGDTSKTTLTLNIVDSGPGTPPAIEKTIDETTDIGTSINGTITVAGATQFTGGALNGGQSFSSNGSQLGGSLKSNGVGVTVTLVGNQYVGKAGDKEVFTLTINSNGTYSFVQKAPLDHADGMNANDIINLHFSYVAKDADGDAVSNTITIHVKDDAPLAVADTNSVPDGVASVNGNVVTNDILSKDVANVLLNASFNGSYKVFTTAQADANGKYVIVQGQYGTLKIYENGSYTYTVNANNTGNHTEQFKYTLIDKDGDPSETTLTLNIVDGGPGAAPAVSQTIDETTDINLSVGGTITVAGATQFVLGDQAGAATFTSGGSKAGGALTSNGHLISVSLEGGQYVGKANGVVIFTLSINNNGQYVFVQKAPIDHADGTNPNDIINLNFTYTAKDADGDAVSNTITINVKDDAPIAVADIGNVPNGSSTATGNVITNDTLSKDVVNLLKDASFGGTTKSFANPDGSDANGKFVIVNGQYGTLKIYENGNYTYTVNAGNNGNHTEQFNYTLVDKDGDTSKTTLTLNIVDNGPGAAPLVEKTIDETTDINVSTGGTITVAGATQFVLGTVTGTPAFSSDGSKAGGALTSNGQSISVSLEGGQYVGKTSNGTVIFTLSINNNGQYTFVLKGPLDHADGANPNDVINLNFAYTAKDADGDAVENQIQIHVKDDAPLAVADIGNIPNGSSTATGNVISNDTLSKDVVNVLKDVSGKSFASPDGTEGGVKYVLVNGQYGQLKIFENGQYTYTLNANNVGNHTEQFNYTLIDKDGDSSQTTLTLNIVDNGPGAAPSVEKTIDETTDLNVSVGGTITVAGATQFALGTATGAGAFSAGGSLQTGSLKSNGVAITVSLDSNGQYVGKAGNVEVFRLTINNNGQYTFVQKAPIDHADGNNANDIIDLNFTYTAKDADGDAVSNTITIHVKDDAPVAVADTNSLVDTNIAVGNVMTNDVMSKDVINTLKDVSFGGTTKSFDTDGLTDAGGKYVVVSGANGVLKMYDNGTYTYTLNGGTPQPGNGGTLNDQFKYTLQDKDGDISQTTLTLDATLPKLIVGENVDDKPGSSTPYEVGTGTGTITGGNASDILVGDVGGNTVTQQPKNYNIVLILDVSGSMSEGSGTPGFNKLQMLQQAVNNLLKDLDAYQGGNVKVHLIPFSTSAGTGQTFDLSTPNGYQAAVNFVNGMKADGYTNYESPLDAADKWYDANSVAGTTNFTYFVTDGNPNRTINANGVVTAVSAVQAMDEILGTDGSNEVAALQGHGEIVSVGIGNDAGMINRLNDIDSDHNSLKVDDPADLTKALQGANPINQLAAVGGDTLSGGNGHDIIFGDVLNTDKLAIAHNLLTPPGSGWMVFAELEANHGWSRTDTINYIRTHAEELGHETVTAQGPRSGGHDTITGGDGNDIIFGQEGNDTINGGNGNDVISGGSGNNTLTGGAGADTFLFLKDDTGHDTITDYSNTQNDKLDISDLLTGSTYQPGISHIEDFVKIDHTTGGVFVDATGHGNFGASNQIGTINNISSFDTINVILNDNEGTKIVHTS